MNSKEYFFNEVIKESLLDDHTSLRILELGCGTASYVPAMLGIYNNLEYIGIEPIKSSYETARDTLQDVQRSKVFLQLGYDELTGVDRHSFDVVTSFSVLEHVK